MCFLIYAFLAEISLPLPKFGLFISDFVDVSVLFFLHFSNLSGVMVGFSEMRGVSYFLILGLLVDYFVFKWRLRVFCAKYEIMWFLEL